MKRTTLVLSIGAAVLAFVAAVSLMQNRLLYFPASATLEGIAVEDLQPWPDAAAFRGLLAPAPATARATAVVFHGNAGHAGHRAAYARALAPLGVRVILAEYPGYGPRPGSPGEETLVADAAETLEQAHRAFGAPLVVVGESLGAAVAAGATARRPDLVTGLVLITPWDRLAHVASHHYPWLPVRWLLRDGYESARRLESFERPVVVAVAEHDRTVPARFGVALHSALNGPKQLRVVPGSDHNDWFGRVDAAWWAGAIGFALGGPGGAK